MPTPADWYPPRPAPMAYGGTNSTPPPAGDAGRPPRLTTPQLAQPAQVTGDVADRLVTGSNPDMYDALTGQTGGWLSRAEEPLHGVLRPRISALIVLRSPDAAVAPTGLRIQARPA